MANETELSVTEIINSWNRDKDKTDSDIINLVKDLGIDDPDFEERRKNEWTSKEKIKKPGGFYDHMLRKYEDIMMKAHGAKETKEFYTDEDDKERKIYITKEPGSRGASKSDLWYSKSRDAAHKAQMKIKDANEAKKLKDEEDAKNLSIWGKMGKHFSENADSRDKLFDYMTSVGRELVKPIEPGKQAAGALIPTLVRGLEKGEGKYAAEKLAETEMLLKRSEAAQKANPLQYYTTKMKELRAQAWAADIDPNTAEGIAWMGQQLSQIGINEGAAQLSAAIKDNQDALIMITDPDRKKEQEELIDKLNGQLLGVITQGLDGGASGSTIPYNPQ